MSAKDTDGGFKNIRYLKSGAVILESYNKEQQEKLRVALKDKTNIKIKETQKMDPMIMVTGVRKGLTNEEFLDDIVNLNEDIQADLGYAITDRIKIVTKKTCRNPTRENWILQASPDVAKWFLKKEKINLDLAKVYVQEHFNLAICFNCSQFGHVAKHCKEKHCCHRCGGEHQGKECMTKGEKCPNCTKLKLKPEDSQHSARDTQCPVYQRRLGQYQRNINYSEAPSDHFLQKIQ